jgi:NAD(P)H-hydrate epimerase
MEKFIPGKNTVVMSRDQVRSFDSNAINQLGIPGVVLMENAGRSCAELIKQILSHKKNPKVCIFCGTGNNGGDGFVIARHLKNYNFNVSIVICGDKNKIKGDAKINLDILERIALPIIQLPIDEPDIEIKVKQPAEGADMLVDGLFGTGLTGRLDDFFQRLITAINSLNTPVLSIDIPSGLDCDTGQSLGAVIRADYTVTFVALKKGFTNKNAAAHTGQIYIASIGIVP